MLLVLWTLAIMEKSQYRKWNRYSFKKIYNAALCSYVGARILPFQRGKGKKCASIAAQLVLAETLLCNFPFFTQGRLFFKPWFQNYTVAWEMSQLLLMKWFLQRPGWLPRGRKMLLKKKKEFENPICGTTLNCYFGKSFPASSHLTYCLSGFKHPELYLSRGYQGVSLFSSSPVPPSCWVFPFVRYLAIN